MKRNLLTAVAAFITAMFVGLPVAQAVDVKLGGEFLTRWEVRNQDFNNDSNLTDFIGQRTRLNANVNMNDNTSAFIQLQSNRIFGQASGGNGGTGGFPSLATGNLGGSGGAGTGTAAPNDGDASVGIHQAYFTLKKFFNLPIDLQVGRQELVLDGHRLLGNTFWTFGASTHDAVKVTHNSGNHTLLYMYSIDMEDGTGAASTQPDDGLDRDMHIFYGQLRGVLGGAFSFSYIFQDQNRGGTGAATITPSLATGTAFSSSQVANDDMHTIGGRQAGKLNNLWGLIYRVEAYGQFGNAACTGGVCMGAGAGQKNVDRNAYMVGVRLGKKFNNVMWKPKVTLWYDRLSGDDDATDGDMGAFNTVVDTGHKFYGFQDLFLGVGTNAGGGGRGTGYRGLQDIAVKFATKPFKKGGLNVDVHSFWTSVGADGRNAAPPAGAAGANTTTARFSNLSGIAGIDPGDSHLGEEIDVTAYYWYNPYLKITAGYSHFFTTDLFHAVQGRVINNAAGTSGRVTSGDDQDWAYVMMNMQF